MDAPACRAAHAGMDAVNWSEVAGYGFGAVLVLFWEAFRIAFFYFDSALFSWCVAHPEADPHNQPPPKDDP